MQNTRLLSVQFCLLFFCIKKNIGVLKDAAVGMGFGSFRREPRFVKARSALLRRAVVHPCLYFILFCPSSWGGVCRRGPFLCLVFQHQAQDRGGDFDGKPAWVQEFVSHRHGSGGGGEQNLWRSNHCSYFSLLKITVPPRMGWAAKQKNKCLGRNKMSLLPRLCGSLRDALEPRGETGHLSVCLRKFMYHTGQTDFFHKMFFSSLAPRHSKAENLPTVSRKNATLPLPFSFISAHPLTKPICR